MGVGEWGGQLRCWTQGGAEVMDGAVGDVTICQLVTHAGTGCGGGAFQHPSALTGLPGFRQDPRPRRGQGPDCGPTAVELDF